MLTRRPLPAATRPAPKPPVLPTTQPTAVLQRRHAPRQLTLELRPRA